VKRTDPTQRQGAHGDTAGALGLGRAAHSVYGWRRCVLCMGGDAVWLEWQERNSKVSVATSGRPTAREM
jgi:hypothetical protein